MIARSLLYTPGDRPDRLGKALGRGADAVIADLEDAVAPARKDEARDAVCDWLASLGDAARERVVVRVNAGDRMEPDALAVVKAGARTLSVPKASPHDLERLDHALGESPARVIALVETAEAVLDARTIAAAPRVVRLAIGEADLAAELGAEPSDAGPELAAIRAQIVLVSAAARLEPPVGPVSTDFGDLDGLRRSSDSLRRMGFGGRAAIHPAQVPVVNEAFTPSDEEVARALRVLQLFEEAGSGVCTGDDGRMIDEAVVRSARLTIDRARVRP